MRRLILFCMFPVLAFAQIALQAGGQTAAFTLKAGGKAAWNIAGAPIGNSPKAPVSDFRISMAGNKLFVQAGTKGLLRLVDSRGRIAATLAVDHDGYAALPHGLPISIYAARFEAPGMRPRIAKLAVVR
ncbi:MAG: hypothetical protein JF616_02415 [Fibrobacteres bacterium]|jgi:hypothetical protein|nr:hypothetical protein [Fibrobacterota bacterium]